MSRSWASWIITAEARIHAVLWSFDTIFDTKRNFSIVPQRAQVHIPALMQHAPGRIDDIINIVMATLNN